MDAGEQAVRDAIGGMTLARQGGADAALFMCTAVGCTRLLLVAFVHGGDNYDRAKDIARKEQGWFIWSERYELGDVRCPEHHHDRKAVR